MTRNSSAITSTQQCCPSIEISLKKTAGYITIALGVTFLVSGIFLILAAYNILPNGINAIGELGMRGYILGYATLISGSLVTAYALWKTFSRKDLNDSFTAAKSQKDVQNSADHESEWENQIKKAAKIDTTPTPNSWKKGIGKKEVMQTFEAFETSEAMKTNEMRNVLNVVIIDDGISIAEKEILQIVSNYLAAVHGVKVNLTTRYILTDQKKRQEQYAAEPNLSLLIKNLPNDAFVLGFMSKDLYPYGQRESINFIFGLGLWEYAAGLFSIFHIRGSRFETTLIRLMRLASHELGHMRGLDHCTHYACCMQGVNSMMEADRIPLTFCALDMAKICRLNGWSLKTGYQRQLDFFESFPKKYKKIVSFSGEIQNLKKKIQIL